jgi:hypothetical protein
MNFSKNLIIIVFLFAIIGAFTFTYSLNTVSADNSTWISYNNSNVGMTGLTATITATIKNTASHVEYFKISQSYPTATIPVNFTVDWTKPQAERMIDPVSPNLGGDYGWEIQPGQTETVSFEVSAYGGFGSIPAYFANQNAVNSTNWPLLPDMGLYTSWFMPDEIQTLNPNLQLKSWSGTFSFTATNLADYAVAGIIRGPIIPANSKLTSSDPAVTFQDTGIVADTGVAAWNVHIGAGDSEFYTYTYEWPLSANGTGNVFNIGNGSSSVFAPKNSTNNTTTVPSQNTGIPYGLLALAAVMVSAGVVYAKFLR